MFKGAHNSIPLIAACVFALLATQVVAAQHLHFDEPGSSECETCAVLDQAPLSATQASADEPRTAAPVTTATLYDIAQAAAVEHPGRAPPDRSLQR